METLHDVLSGSITWTITIFRMVAERSVHQAERLYELLHRAGITLALPSLLGTTCGTYLGLQEASTCFHYPSRHLTRETCRI
eukprot:231089-Amphidinium_carterae.1